VLVNWRLCDCMHCAVLCCTLSLLAPCLRCTLCSAAHCVLLCSFCFALFSSSPLFLDLVEQLLDAGASVSEPEDNALLQPLHLACMGRITHEDEVRRQRPGGDLRCVYR
jgi:hypothetical protein